MKIEIPIPEIEEFIKSYFKVAIGIIYVEQNKIDVNYMTTLRLTIEKVEHCSVLLRYELNWAANFIAKGAKFMVNSKMDDRVLFWDTNAKTLSVNLLNIDAMRDFLAVYHIQTFEIVDDKIVLEMATNPKTL